MVFKKNNVRLLIGSMAMVALAGVAQAETRFAVQDNSANDKMVVTDTGYVGVGTSAPSVPVQVKGATTKDATIDLNFAGATAYNKFDGPTMQFTRNNLSTDNGGLPKDGDRLGYMNFGAMINGKFYQGAQMNSLADATTPWSATSHAGAFTFSTTEPGKEFATERMRVTSAGNIGVGTSIPTQKLEVNGGVRLNSATSKPACTSATRGTIWFSRGTTDTLEVCAQINGATPIWRAVTLQ